MSARRKPLRRGPLVTIIRADLWDDEPEILDRVVSADHRNNRTTAAGLLLSDVVLSIKRMSRAELEAFLAGVYARRGAHFTNAEIARRQALGGRAA